MRRDILAGSGPTTLTKIWYVNGDQVDAGVVTYAVINGAGTSVASGTATKTGTGATTSYSFSLAIVTDPTVLRVRWTRSDTGAYSDDWLEVAGSVLFTEGEARAKQTTGQAAPLASATAYPDDAIATWRLKISEAFEQRTGRSWVRRYCRLETAGTGRRGLNLRDGYPRISLGDECGGPGRIRDIRRVLSVTADGTAIATSNVTIIGQELWRTDAAWPTSSASDPLNVVVEYEYGVDPTWEAHENGLRSILAFAPPQSSSDWMTSISDEGGSRSFELAWPPKVWDWLKTADARVRIA